MLDQEKNVICQSYHNVSSSEYAQAVQAMGGINSSNEINAKMEQ